MSGPRSSSILQRNEVGRGWSGSSDSSPSPSDDYYYNDAIVWQDLVYSIGHQDHRDVGKVPYDIGGNFFVIKRDLEERNFGPVHNRTVDNDDNPFAGNYEGSYYAERRIVDSSSFLSPNTIDSDELNNRGTTAIALTIPTNPASAVLQTFLELRQEGIPLLIGNSLLNRTRRARDAGGEYLNVEFGWKPLVSDVTDIAKSFLNASALLEHYRKNSGRPIRRSFRWPQEFSIEEFDEGSHYPDPAIQVGFWNQQGTKRTIVTRSEKQWFEAVYTYLLDPPGSLSEYEEVANRILGTRLTPETLWNITPWSWLADWQLPLGNIIHNVSALTEDGLVIRQAYLMTEQKVSREVMLGGWEMKNFPGVTNYCSQKFTETWKSRYRASPYGFGLQGGDLSSHQMAILTALGIARGGGKLYND